MLHTKFRGNRSTGSGDFYCWGRLNLANIIDKFFVKLVNFNRSSFHNFRKVTGN